MIRRVATIALASALILAAQGRLSPLDEAGYRQLLGSRKGKVVLVDFWATYCTPCRAETPKLVALAAKLHSKGFEFITVSADEPEQEASAAKFASEMHIPGTAYMRKAKDDDKFISFVDPKWTGALPALFLYDRTGRKVRSFIGENPIAAIEAAIAKLL